MRAAAARLLAAAAAALCIAAASDPAEVLPDPAQEARARALFTEIRCVVCQNESIDGSNAELAQDLRRVVRDKVAEGRSDAEIKQFLVDRYGEFVLFRPKFSPGNLLLWAGPFAVVLLAGTVLLLTARRARAERPDVAVDLTREERARLRALTKDDV